jgi:DNA-binding response OmpR family regulator
MCYTLIIDDDKDLCDILKFTFDTYKVDTANSLKEAEDLIEQARPDIIILDLMVGNENGHDFLKHNVLHSAVIVITGLKVTEDLEMELLEDGATMVLEKPVNLRKLKLITDRVATLMNVDVVIRQSTARLIDATKQLKQLKLGKPTPVKASN